MKLSEPSQNLVSNLFKELVRKYATPSDPEIITDFYIQPLRETGEVIIYDDDDKQLCRTVIPEWADYPEDTFYSDVQADLQSVMHGVNTGGALEKLAVWKPYSFVMVDEERESVCDLMLVDDDTLIVTNDLLKGLDEELNDFLEKLLEE